MLTQAQTGIGLPGGSDDKGEQRRRAERAALTGRNGIILRPCYWQQGFKVGNPTGHENKKEVAGESFFSPILWVFGI